MQWSTSKITYYLFKITYAKKSCIDKGNKNSSNQFSFFLFAKSLNKLQEKKYSRHNFMSKSSFFLVSRCLYGLILIGYSCTYSLTTTPPTARTISPTVFIVKYCLSIFISATSLQYPPSFVQQDFLEKNMDASWLFFILNPILIFYFLFYAISVLKIFTKKRRHFETHPFLLFNKYKII